MRSVNGDDRRPVIKRRQSDEEELLTSLFTDYNKFARPLINSSSTVVVTLQFSLMHIKDLVSFCQLYFIIKFTRTLPAKNNEVMYSCSVKPHTLCLFITI